MILLFSKKCVICKKEFIPRDIIQCTCMQKVCQKKREKQRTKEYRQENIDIIKRREKNYKQKNKELISFKRRIHRQENLEKYRERDRIHNEKRREKERIRARERYFRLKNDPIYKQKTKEGLHRWYQKHKQQHALHRTLYSIEHREHLLQKKKEYNAKLENKKIRKEWFDENRDKINQSRKIYRQNHGHEICRMCSQRRYAKKKGVIHAFTREEWEQKVNATNGICPICKENIGLKKFSLDHNPALSKVEMGHIYTIKDVEPMCKPCNSSKRVREMEEFLRIRQNANSQNQVDQEM
jgi:hypothetical protein